MKKLLAITFGLMLGTSFVSSVASAQGRQQDRGQMRTRQMQASDILGESIYSQDNQEIGEIQKIFIDRRQGNISSVSVDVSDFMQTGKNMCKIPWDQVSLDQGSLRVNMDASSIGRMCPTRSKKQKGMRQDQGTDQQYQMQYDDQRRYQRNPRYESEMGDEYEEDRGIFQDQQMQQDQRMEQDQQMQQDQQAQPQSMTTDRLLGTEVYNMEDEEIGEVEEILIDRESGEVSGVVVGIGGFLGMGESACRVNWDEMSQEGDRFILKGEEDPNAPCPYGEEWSEDRYDQEYGIGIE